MASEVIAGRYLVRFTSNSDLEDPAQIIGTGSIIKPPFAYNPLHDMESIRWILVYLPYFRKTMTSKISPMLISLIFVVDIARAFAAKLHAGYRKFEANFKLTLVDERHFKIHD
ncbi:hypothetical protein DFJ43DRAFT_1044451 [Lentinula guzmanii]|nr:hypothetical protein DFJ43DRAFT_1044451 [Lentinula guzmanii]KAJ3779511.1 hypothetical protein GGU10DRAFT_382383 [Lentinula aff. detonsa]